MARFFYLLHFAVIVIIFLGALTSLHAFIFLSAFGKDLPEILVLHKAVLAMSFFKNTFKTCLVPFLPQSAASMFCQDQNSDFQQMLDSVYEMTSHHLLDVLQSKYKFLEHLKVCMAGGKHMITVRE